MPHVRSTWNDVLSTETTSVTALAVMHVVKSFLLGCALDLNSLMIVTTILIIAFAIECFLHFYLLRL